MQTGTYSYPTTVGHEFAGDVVEVGPGVAGWTPGDRVTVIPLIPCGECPSCKLGKYHLCDSYDYFGSRRDGAFAEYVAVPTANLLRLPDSVDYETAAMTDPASVALHAVRKSGLSIGESVAVLGAGPIGAFAIQWAKIAGAGLVAATDVQEPKLILAKELGADVTVNARNEDPVAALHRVAPGGFSRVIEIAGSPAAQEQAIHIARKGGAVVYCGISHARLPLSESSVDVLMRREISIVGSWNSGFAPDESTNDWATSVHFFGQRALRALPLVTHRYALDQVKQAFAMAADRGSYFNKILFLP
jgi:L-iditol 2-dehydrogenase